MHHSPPLFDRRRLLRAGGLLAASQVASAWAQPGKPAAARGATIAQIVDYSPMQQDVSRDFLTGSRAAWQDINARGGIRGKSVQHQTFETDGTPEGLRAALDAVKSTASCVALSGSAGDPLAGRIVQQLERDSLAIAHVAPWLQSDGGAVDERTFPIFATRQEQIAHALKTLAGMGMSEIGAIYATTQEHEVNHIEVERIAAGMKLSLRPFRASGDLRALGQKLTPATPAVLLFVGGTPELAEFTQGLAKQARQRYVVALADVNLGTMLQMGAARSTPVIATQVVPLVNASLPVVRQYRELLAKLFDEAPTPLGLAGFIAARYTYEVLADIDGPLTRQSALAAFQRRANVDIGGFRVAYNGQRRGAGYVTQSMLSADGRVVG